eukprot:gene25919-31727_t
MVYTAVVTPYEVAFLSVRLNMLFVVNRIVDFCFFVDIVFNFNMQYIISGTSAGRITDRKRIIRQYLTGWFFLDALSVLPFDATGLIIGSQAVSQLK